MTVGAPTQAQPLAERVRAYWWQRIVAHGVPITYHDLAKALQLTPPNRIHLVTEALDLLMAEDIKVGRPLIAAIAISQVRTGLQAPGFFDCAARLGRFSGDAAGPEGWAFHARKCHTAVTLWAASGRHGEGASRIQSGVPEPGR